MRVLITTDTVGGVWTFTRELAQGLLDHGSTVALFSVGRMPNTSQQQWLDAMHRCWGSSFCFQASDTPLEWMQDNEAAFSGAAPHLLRLIDRFKPDVLHCNQFCFGALPVGIPKIVTAHSDVFSWALACAAAPLAESPWLDRYRRLVRNGLDGADALTAPTRWMLDAVGGNFVLPGSRQVIPNGRSIAHASHSARKLQAVTAGRLWDEAKGLALLRDLDFPIPLLVAGESTCHGAAQPSPFGQARLLGALGEYELLTLFSESAIYLCPSLYEPFGLAPLEAALCGCAVVARDIPSLREVWQDQALFFNDDASLTRLLRTLAADPELLALTQARCLSHAQRYTREAMTSAYLSLFQQTVIRQRELAHVA